MDPGAVRLADTSARGLFETGDDSHAVCFYEAEEFLVRSLTDFVEPSWRDGGVAVVVATEAHRHATEAALDERGHGLDDLRGRGQLVLLDAADLLAGFYDAGNFHAAGAKRMLGAVLASAARRGGQVRVFGEMVALLWDGGDIAAAIRLEQVWNELAEEHPFALLCGYPMTAMEGRDGPDLLRRVCDHHSLVVPAESYTDQDDARRMAVVVELQWAARMAGHHPLVEPGSADADRFLALAAHDLQAPVAVVRGVADLLEADRGRLAADEVEDLLERLSRNAARLGRFAADVLTATQLRSAGFDIHAGRVALPELVSDAVADEIATTGRAIDVDCPTAVPEVEADTHRQRQILSNLLSNATKFSPPDTPVRVTVTARPDHVRVAVRDEGYGIPAQHVPTLFEPFVRLEGERGPSGTGLGLYIVRLLVEAQGGAVEVDSTPGQGSTFSYTVPIASTA